MSERIRYRQLNDSQMESIQTFEHANNIASYKVLITKKTPENDANKFQIVETGSELVAASGSNVNYPKLQKEVREALTKLGIELSRGNRVHNKSATE